MLDQSQSGVITAENLFEEMKRVDSEITFGEVEDVLKKVDSDGSGTIDFDEFLYYITQMGDGLAGDCKQSLCFLCISNVFRVGRFYGHFFRFCEISVIVFVFFCFFLAILS